MTPKPTFHHSGLDWIPHTPGDPMPCPGGTRVRALLRNGVYDPEPTQSAFYLDWSDDEYLEDSIIIGWHPVEEQPSLARRVLDLLESGDIEQAKHKLRKELE
jgi:hypothetical protein